MSSNTSDNLEARIDTARTSTAHTSAGGGAQRSTPRWLVVLLAMAGALIVWVIGQVAGVGDVVVDTGAALQPVTIASVVVASLLAGLAGWGVRALIGRIDKNVKRARVIWLVLGGVVLLGSLMGVMGAVTPGAMVLLLAEHMVVGLIVMVGLRR